MEEAVSAIEKGMTVRNAAEMYGVPRSTLHDHISGRVKYGVKSGPPQYLTTAEEEELASFLVETSRIGYPHTKKQILTIVQQILESKGITAEVTEGWWQRFHKRHPHLTMKSAVPLSYVRAQAHDEDVLIRYYDMLHECLTTNDILNKPSAIFNCDETGMPLNPKCHKVVSEVGSKHTGHITGNRKGQTTVLACTCAAGYAIPPLVVFDRKTLNMKATEGEVPGTFYGLSSSGWMTQDLFYHWFEHQFLQYAPQIRPLLLLMDGHSSHYNPETIKLAAKNGVILFTLPPNTTHITQPLDRACFAPLKAAWRHECHAFYTSHPGRVVTHLDFCGLFSNAWYKAMTPRTITASFKVTGICPYDRSSIQLGGVDKKSFSAFNPANLVIESGLKYIPLYSPTSKTRRTANSIERNEAVLHQSPYVKSDHSDSETGDSSLELSSFSKFSHDKGTATARQSITISKFLLKPLPPSALPTKRVKSCGKILMSQLNQKLLEEKEREKEEKEKQKEEKRKRRNERLKKGTRFCNMSYTVKN